MTTTNLINVVGVSLINQMQRVLMHCAVSAAGRFYELIPYKSSHVIPSRDRQLAAETEQQTASAVDDLPALRQHRHYYVLYTNIKMLKMYSCLAGRR